MTDALTTETDPQQLLCSLTSDGLAVRHEDLPPWLRPLLVHAAPRPLEDPVDWTAVRPLAPVVHCTVDGPGLANLIVWTVFSSDRDSKAAFGGYRTTPAPSEATAVPPDFFSEGAFSALEMAWPDWAGSEELGAKLRVTDASNGLTGSAAIAEVAVLAPPVVVRGVAVVPDAIDTGVFDACWLARAGVAVLGRIEPGATSAGDQHDDPGRPPGAERAALAPRATITSNERGVDENDA